MSKELESDRTLVPALIAEIKRIADALEHPTDQTDQNLPDDYNAFVYCADHHSFRTIPNVICPPLHLLKGIDRNRDTLLENTKRFAMGASANNALLWGARGMGKSTLIKAVHAYILNELATDLALVEIHHEDIYALPNLMELLARQSRATILFCDDLSFSQPDKDFKALKSVLEGGLEGRPDNVIFYATSNRRHMMPRKMMDQEQATGIHPTETMDETIALSDRFGLWLGFHPCNQSEYLDMVKGYIDHLSLKAPDNWQDGAKNWSKTRGSRSGRIAWHYVQDLAGSLNVKVRL